MNIPTSPPKNKTLTGIVTQIIGNRILFTTNAAASYDAETAQATFFRRNDTPILFSDILVGDKIKIEGKLWEDNSMNAVSIQNISLYPHTGTYTGKIISIDPVKGTFTIQNTDYGLQTIHTDNLTVLRKNNINIGLRDLKPGLRAKVKGIWERNRDNLLGKQVIVKARLINISLIGKLVMRSDDALTVVSNKTIYGIDITKARIINKNNKPLLTDKLIMGGQVRIEGKHIAESNEIIGSIVKDLSI